MREVWAVCPVPRCQRGLCATHFGLAGVGRDTTQSRCHEHGALPRDCPCRQCHAMPPTTTRDTETPRTTITILSDDDLRRIETNRRMTLDRRAMLKEDARSRHVADVLATIQANRQAALDRRRRLQQSSAEDHASKRPRTIQSPSILSIPGLTTPHGAPPPGWQQPTWPDAPTDFLHGRIPEAVLRPVCVTCDGRVGAICASHSGYQIDVAGPTHTSVSYVLQVKHLLAVAFPQLAVTQLHRHYTQCVQVECVLLRELHRHPRDIRIRFVADTHTYFIDGTASLGSFRRGQYAV